MPIRNSLSIKLYLATGFALIFLLSACSLLPKEQEMVAPPLVESAQVEYDIEEVKKGEIIKRLTGIANFVPVGNENLYFEQEGGRLKKIHVAQGDLVKKGDILIEIDSGNLANDIKHLEIDYEKSDLHVQQLIAQGADEFAIKIAKLDRDGFELRLSQMREQLSLSRIVSPMDGIITFLTEQKLGENIEAYQSLIQVADISNIQLHYSAMTISDLEDVHVGMDVNVSVGGNNLIGKVVQTPENIPDNATEIDSKQYEQSILIDIADIPKDVEIGETAEIEIVTAQKSDTLIIPKTGLRTSGGRDYVLLLVGDSRREVDIETGIISKTEVEIIKGIDVGDQVILK